MPQLLVELFSEEIPARMQANAARDLERMARERLTAAGLTPSSLTAFAGPRRLTLLAEGLPVAQGDTSEEVKGPRVGAPPQAMEGFLRKTGLTQDQLTERDGVYFATLTKTGGPTAAIVAAMVDEIVRGFPWPKSMRWGSGALRWVRPLKRIVCLFDGAVVPFEIDGVVSGDITEGHRFMGDGQPFTVRDFDSYSDGLTDHFVVLDAAARKATIKALATKICAERGLELVEDEGLLDEVAGLAEWPVPILGDMDPAFLDLPPEVIRTSMRTHQKYFAVRDPKTGKLAAHFVTVANNEAADGGKIIALGNAKVLSARLSDARFFWDEDIKAGFDAWLGKLDGVTFHAKLGTMAQRVERIVALAKEIAPLVGADPDKAAEAARLAKADLTSGMAGEFPELQGLMGGYYARAAGMDADIADAIRDHYKPVGPSDSVPTAPVSIAVALADKLDTLVGFFAIDEKPTGSKDPQALRRAALGVIRTILESNARIELRDLLLKKIGRLISNLILDLKTDGLGQLSMWWAKGSSVDGERTMFRDFLSAAATNAPENMPTVVGIRDDLLAFFADRLKASLRDQGKRHDLVDAVFALGDDDLVRIVSRVEALDGFLKTEDGANLLAGYKRASNILKAEEKKGALPSGEATTLAGAPGEEIALLSALTAAAPKLDAALKIEDFAAAMTALAALRAPVDLFFEKVLVNSEVATERENRLKLLGQVRDLMGRVADFSQVSG
jgi:glycyl-tRNA synthetase beta chain